MFSLRSSALAILLGSSLLSLAAAGCGSSDQSDYMLMNVAYADAKQDASCYPNGETPGSIKDDTTSFRTGGTLVMFQGPDDAYYLQTETLVLEGTRDGDVLTFGGKSVDVEYINGTPGETIVDTDQDGIDDNNDNMVDADKDGLDDRFEDDDVDTDKDGLDDRYDDDVVDANKDGVDDRYKVIKPPTDGDKLTTTTETTVSIKISGGDVSGSTETLTHTTCKGATCPKETPSCKASVTFVGTLVQDAKVEHQI